MEERRRGNRIKLESTLVLNRLDGNEGQKVEIDISDVSKSGIGFNCKGLLEIGSVYEAFLRIWTQEVIHAFWRSSGSKNAKMGTIMALFSLECRKRKRPELRFMIQSERCRAIRNGILLIILYAVIFSFRQRMEKAHQQSARRLQRPF